MLKGWTTWDGRSLPIEEISHQHLSNIYYYITFVLPKQYPQSVKVEVYNTLIQRFGNIMPYRPDPNYLPEKEYLLQLGFLRNNNEIYIFGKKVGEYPSI